MQRIWYDAFLLVVLHVVVVCHPPDAVVKAFRQMVALIQFLCSIYDRRLAVVLLAQVAPFSNHFPCIVDSKAFRCMPVFRLLDVEHRSQVDMAFLYNRREESELLLRRLVSHHEMVCPGRYLMFFRRLAMNVIPSVAY